MLSYAQLGQKQSDRERQETKTDRQTDISNTKLGSSGPLGETEPHEQSRNSVCLLGTAYPRGFSVREQPQAAVTWAEEAEAEIFTCTGFS